MSDPLEDPAYWKGRLDNAPHDLKHWAIYRCHTDLWNAIGEKHREILAKHIRPDDSILDAGCAWGRLLDLLPNNWNGWYWGVDLSPDFIALAKKTHPHNSFKVGRLQDVLVIPPVDWIVLVSVRPMLIRHLGSKVWEEIEINLRRSLKVGGRFLYLEYNPELEGSVEE